MLFFDQLFRLAGLPARHYRARSLVRRLPSCLRQLGVRDVEEATRVLIDNPQLVPVIVDVALLGVTEFCRDQPVFDELRRTVLPALRARFVRLRAWSAACSSGHELYSVAMLMDSLGCLGSAELVGTDCRPQAIDAARAGVFADDALQRIDPRWRQRYFTSAGAAHHVRSSLRDAVRWHVADLFDRVEAGPWHLVLWRNMAIYLHPLAAEGIWRRMCDELAPGGFLVTGKADHPPAFLPLQRVSSCIYRRRDG